MAKGQKRSNREPRKPKQEKPRPAASPPSDRSAVQGLWASSHAKGQGR